MIVETSAIVAQGLGIRRGGRWLLRPASFGLPGGVIGIAGPSGSGKSVLLATLATLRRPSTGSLEVLGHHTGTRRGLSLLRSRIGFLPADAHWASGTTVHDFVSYAAYYQRRPPTSVRRILEGLDLTDVANWQLNELPADLRVRAGLAAACVHEPEIAFLDAPLKDAGAADLVPLIASIAPTVVLTAADPSDLAWCDHLYVLDKARLTRAGDRPLAQADPKAERPTPNIAASWADQPNKRFCASLLPRALARA